MKWEGRRQSNNVEDRRGLRGGGGKLIAGGGIIGVIVLLLQLFGGETGQQVASVVNQVAGGAQQGGTPTEQVELTPEQKKIGDFTATVLADTEDVWQKIFSENGLGTYEDPKLVLFTSQVNTGCGTASSAVGPFYCPADHKLYMDMDFFEELKTRFGAKGGDFAIAYVMAHEVGHHNKKYLDADDIDEALSAAHAVGDDAIQKRMQGHVVPDSFTHGTSEQRKYWFMKGYNTGDIREGNINTIYEQTARR